MKELIATIALSIILYSIYKFVNIEAVTCVAVSAIIISLANIESKLNK